MESPNEVKEKNKNANNNQWVYPGWIPIDKKEEDKDAVPLFSCEGILKMFGPPPPLHFRDRLRVITLQRKCDRKILRILDKTTRRRMLMRAPMM